MIPLTANTSEAAAKVVKEPNLVLCMDGIEDCYGSGTIYKVIRVGDPDLFIDGSWVVGGKIPISNQKTYLSLQGSSTSIRQQIDYDKGRGSSIQSLAIELIDINSEVTELITPGLVVDDILGRKAKIYLAVDGPSCNWPQDYILLFRGVIDDVQALPASVVLTIAHPDQKKKQSLYQRHETKLVGAITDIQTTITVEDATPFILRVLGPDLTYDPSFKSYVVIDEEVIEFTGVSGNDLTGCVRGQLNTIAAAHADESDVGTLYRLKGTAMDLALKIMLSKGGPYLTGVSASSFNTIPGEDPVPNIIYFDGVDVVQEFGVSLGDYVSTTGAANGANNVTDKTISAIFSDEFGSYIELNGVAFVDEDATPAVLSIRSKYDTLPQGLGLGADEVDVRQHEYLKQQYLSSFNYDFYLKDTVENMRDWMDLEIYRPASAYSVVRKARCSAQMLIGPIPGGRTAILDKSNIINPGRLKLRRTINKNFYNTIIYKYEEDELEDKFRRGKVTQNLTSLSQIPVGVRALLIESKGLREVDLGGALAQSASLRRLNRYKYGAEFIDGVSIKFGYGFDIEIGDVVVFDPTDLHVANTVDGDRFKPAALFEVSNKNLNYKTGEITVDLVDTAFDENARYGLFSPSSIIKAGISNTQFVIEPSYGLTFGSAEFQKWQRYSDVMVVVKSPDGTTRYAEVEILTADSNTITVASSLGFTPQPGDIMELAPYAVTNAQLRLIYGFMGDPLSNADPDFVML